MENQSKRIDLPLIANEILRRFPKIHCAYLFGSAAADEVRPDSDLDIALLQFEALAPSDVIFLKGYLSEKFRRDNEERHEIYASDSSNLRNDQNKQDAILLNIERACHAAIDMAMRTVKLRRLGLPKESRDAFDFLKQAGLIDADLCSKMHGLVGFRNTAIRNYKKLDLNIVEAIIKDRIDDFRLLSKCLIIL